MQWNVYRYSINRNKVVSFNIFDHGSFYNDIKEDFKQCSNKEEFAKKLRSNVFYYFWCKSEHEITISSYPPYITEKELDRLKQEQSGKYFSVRLDKGVRVDIYEQVMLNFNIFLDYTWSNRTKLLESED